MEIKRLFGKPKTYKIAGQEMEIHPLTVKEIDTLTKLESKDKQSEGIMELITKTLKKSYPTLNENDIENISVEHYVELQKAILDVNGIPVPDELK